MTTARRVAVALAGLTVLASVVGATAAGLGLRDEPADRGEERTGQRVGREGCRGVAYDEVRGPRLRYGPRRLASFPGERALCAAYWLPGANRVFVPQGLALDEGRVWVGGYRWNPELGLRSCTVVAVHPRTGRELASAEELYGAVPGSDPRYCHHGGGLALTDEGLWLAETQRLWLLDPDAIGAGGDPVLRLWRIEEPLRGSVLLQDRGRIALGAFRNDGPAGGVHWFDIPDLLRPGVVALVEEGADPWEAAQSERERGVAWMQGGTVTRAGTYLAQSHTYCGVVRRPDGRRVGVMPGTEDIEFDERGDLWTLSESGARNYQLRGGRPMVPMLARFDADVYLSGPRPKCRL